MMISSYLSNARKVRVPKQTFLPFRLSVPHNGDPALLGCILESDWVANVAEVYFAGNPLVLPSGRRPKIRHYISDVHGTPTFDSTTYDLDLRAAIRRLSSRSIRCNLLLNADIVLTSEQIGYVENLLVEGLRTITAGNTALVRQLYSLWGGRVALQNSVYITIRAISDVQPLLDLGVSVFLVPPEWNHDFDTLERIRQSVASHGGELKVMVNEGCVKYCPHRSDDLRDAQHYPVEVAIRDYRENPNELRNPGNPCRKYLGSAGIGRTNYVHPNDIRAYIPFDPTLKIVGRSFHRDNILRACSAYLTGAFDGDLRDIVENFKHASAPVMHVPGAKAVFCYAQQGEEEFCAG